MPEVTPEQEKGEQIEVYKPIPDKTNWERFIEFRYLTSGLSHIHAVFYQIHEMGGVPIFVDDPSLPTACIKFDFKGTLEPVFMFNSGFWDHLDEYNRMFIVCHECLHVLFNHGHRLHEIATKQPQLMQIANVAADIAINHALVSHFNFNRFHIEGHDKLCWVDTVFPNEDVPTDENFEYYFNKILKDNPPTIVKVRLADDHGELAGGNATAQGSDGKADGKVTDFIEKLGQALTDYERESLKNSFKEQFQEANQGKTPSKPGGQQAGNGAGNLTQVMRPEKVVPKRKWETVIKDWSLSFKPRQKVVPQWAMPHRRFMGLDSGELIIPTDAETDAKDLDMIEVWFFQDTSGSCVDLAPRFFKAAKTLPEDRFFVRMFCFDTRVYETDLKTGKLYGFGGTSFSCIQNYVQTKMAELQIEKCPTIFVITDGYGDTPNIPEDHRRQWHWFLSEDYRRCIPDKCNIYKLADYE